MDVLLLGTGSAEGWPNPFCTCASCAATRAAGVWRTPTAALVDGRVLLDCGPEAARAADRAGASLARVRHLLVTHGHPDHFDPAALLWRGWAGRREPLQVAGPAEALETARPWLALDAPVRLRPVSPGDVVDLDGYAARALAAAHDVPAVLWDVTAPDGRRLLYATDTGPLPEATLTAVAGAAYDMVLMEETFGDFAGHGRDHLDLATFPRQLARMRAVGALTPATDIVAVHLGHHNPPSPELDRRLASWGARVVPDGTVLSAGQSKPPPPRPTAPARTLVLGGARAGKSLEAERRLAAEPEVHYLATAGDRPGDAEWERRVREHRARRSPGWTTLETDDLEGVLSRPGPPVLVDCLGLWLTGVLDAAGAWDDAAWAAGAEQRVAVRGQALVTALRTTTRRVVLVSNEVGSGVVPATVSGRRFRDELGRLNAAVSAACEETVLMVAGRPVPLAGGPASGGRPG